MNSAKSIPFTQTHENLLIETSEKLDRLGQTVKSGEVATNRNTKAIEINRIGIDRNSKAIEINRIGIDRNSKAIEINRIGIDRNLREIHRIGVLVEDQSSSIQAILEIANYINQRFRKQDEIDEKVERHEYRISAIELHLRPKS